MANYVIEIPGKGKFQVDSDAELSDAQAYQYATSQASAPAPAKIGAAGFGDALRQTLGEASWGARNLASAGTALSNLWEGGKQILGKGDPQAIEANRIMAQEAPVGSIAGNMALLAPTALVPGANTVAGAGLVGALTGAFQPTQGDESRLLNTALGTAGGLGGQWVGNKVGGYLTNRLAGKEAEAAAQKSVNSVRDSTLQAAQDAGYVVPPSAVKPTWLNNRLEGLAGKAAIKQASAGRNQEMTNALARKALDMSEDAPITEGTLKALRKEAAAPYREIAELPTLPPDRLKGIGGYPLIGPEKQTAAAALRDLKLVRKQANDYWKEYTRSGLVSSQEKAVALGQQAQKLEQHIEDTALASGRDDLVQALRAARQKIAKSFDVERALNLGSGDISAPIIGRALDKGSPLTGELATIGKFAEAFPQFATEGAKIPAAGVSKSEALAAALLGTTGAAASGNPFGALAGVLPFLSGPARSLVLSKGYQGLMAKPDYAVGMGTKALGQITPERAGIFARSLLQGAAPAEVLE